MENNNKNNSEKEGNKNSKEKNQSPEEHKKKEESSGLDESLDYKYASQLPSGISGSASQGQGQGQQGQEPTKEEKEKLEKTRKELESLKDWIVKQYPFTKSLSILPPQSVKLFVDEEEVPKETENHTHLYMIVPEDNFKEISNIKKEIVKKVESLNTDQKIWLQIKTPVDVWENCFDSKFELTKAIGMSYPLYDTGILGILRVSEIHKSMVLQKFEKYVVSYVVYGSLVSQGKADKKTDIDVSVIINDTDVKKMSSVELKERLRNIIYQYVSEAVSMAGVENSLHVQTWLLTEFWQEVKDANPVMFTFIRDGAPLYDRGTFMPWKALLKRGKLTPTPEAIDSFFKSADKTQQMVDRRLVDATIDLYYKVLNPSQALIMLYGYPPPTHKETPEKMKEIFYNKEKMLEKKYINTLDKAVKLFKSYEDGDLKSISGTEIDKLVKDSNEFLNRLKELRKDIEKRSQKDTIEKVHKDVFDLLKSIFGKKSQEKLMEDFENKFVKTGKFSKQHSRILKNIVEAKKDFKKGKIDSYKVDQARKNATTLMNALTEFSQRRDLVASEKATMKIKYKKGGQEKTANLLLAPDGTAFLFEGQKVKKITESGVKDSSQQEATKAWEKETAKNTYKLEPEIFDSLKKEVGDFEVEL